MWSADLDICGDVREVAQVTHLRSILQLLHRNSFQELGEGVFGVLKLQLLGSIAVEGFFRILLLHILLPVLRTRKSRRSMIGYKTEWIIDIMASRTHIHHELWTIAASLWMIMIIFVQAEKLKVQWRKRSFTIGCWRKIQRTVSSSCLWDYDPSSSASSLDNSRYRSCPWSFFCNQTRTRRLWPCRRLHQICF